MKKIHQLFLGFSIISVLISVVGVVNYAQLQNISESSNKVLDVHFGALIILSQMKAVLLEGVQEGFAYVLLNDEIEKKEFYENMGKFDLLAQELLVIENYFADDPDERLAFESVIATKKDLVESATYVFENYEKTGKLEKSDLDSFENSIDRIIPLLDDVISFELYEVKIQNNMTQENIFFSKLLMVISISAIILTSMVLGKIITNSISKYLQQLKELDKAKDAFLAMITHELKTPLVPIQGYSDMLLGEHLGKLTSKQKDRISVIKSSSESLLDMISDILDISKIESNKLKMEKNIHDLSKIVKDVITQFKPILGLQNISIYDDVECGISLDIDKKRIKQVLSNLIQNAIQHGSKENAKILVSLSKENSFVIVSIKDNGTGIPTSELDNIFTKFYQTDTSLTRTSGTGLGLAVCKGIIENHGGKIWAKSQGIDRGSEFYFTLPISQ